MAITIQIGETRYLVRFTSTAIRGMTVRATAEVGLIHFKQTALGTSKENAAANLARKLGGEVKKGWLRKLTWPS